MNNDSDRIGLTRRRKGCTIELPRGFPKVGKMPVGNTCNHPSTVSEKEGEAVPAFAGPMSFTAGGPNLSRSASCRLRFRNALAFSMLEKRVLPNRSFSRPVPNPSGPGSSELLSEDSLGESSMKERGSSAKPMA